MNECLDEIRKTNPDLAEVLVAEAKSRYPKDHPDRWIIKFVLLSLVALIIIGALSSTSRKLLLLGIEGRGRRQQKKYWTARVNHYFL